MSCFHSHESKLGFFLSPCLSTVDDRITEQIIFVPAVLVSGLGPQLDQKKPTAVKYWRIHAQQTETLENWR